MCFINNNNNNNNNNYIRKIPKLILILYENKININIAILV